MSFLEIALSHAALGLYVFPVAKDKSTRTAHGYKDATLDPEQIRAWWATMPSANPGFAPGVSGVAVLDIDHGLTDMASFLAWCNRNGIPPTYVVRSGSRPEFKVHLYFKGAIPDVGIWELDGCSGQVKSLGGYVLAAGSEALHGANHDKPGAPYEAICGTLGTFTPLPDVIRQLRKPTPVVTSSSKVPKTAWSLPVHAGENRTGFLLEQTGAMRNLGCGKDAIFARMIELNDDPEIIADPVDGDRLESTATNCAKFPVPEAEPRVVFGQAPAKKVITDWREHYHTVAEHDGVGPPNFLIEGFLQCEAIMGIGAFVGNKKTLLALNMAWSLCSGDALFGKFEVTRRPSRVLYLGPENGMISFADRVNKIGLREYLGKTFFYTTMKMPEKLPLSDLTPDEIRGAVIFVDTMIRYTDGSENDASQMKAFAELAFALIRDGAECVVLLHHSSKIGARTDELTLENCFRGSGELVAFLSGAVGIKTQDMTDEYKSASLIKFVKQRDFESKPSSFEVLTSKETCRMTFVEGSHGAVLVKKTTANRDGKDPEALEILRQNPSLSVRAAVAKLKELGITRGKTWVGDRMYEQIQAAGGKLPTSKRTVKSSRRAGKKAK